VTDVFVYGKSSCVQCEATERAMKSKGLPYVYLDLESDPVKAEEFRDAGHLTAPVIEVREGRTVLETWAGFRHDRIKAWAKEVNG